MRILIDIGHPAQLNYLKYSIFSFSQYHNIFVTYLKRGRLGKIINQELSNSNIKIKEIGKHRGTIFSIIWDANICRFFQFIKFIYLNKIELGINGGFSVGLALRILHRPYILFDDDF